AHPVNTIDPTSAEKSAANVVKDLNRELSTAFLPGKLTADTLLTRRLPVEGCWGECGVSPQNEGIFNVTRHRRTVNVARSRQRFSATTDKNRAASRRTRPVPPALIWTVTTSQAAGTISGVAQTAGERRRRGGLGWRRGGIGGRRV